MLLHFRQLFTAHKDTFEHIQVVCNLDYIQICIFGLTPPPGFLNDSTYLMTTHLITAIVIAQNLKR